MYFKRINLHGFKSFADPVSIEFDKGITCVVGPNGSGKSNISDALRWVLGEQSPKMLRGGKMDEVIFAGTASRKSRGMAEVTLVIDNADGSLPIDFSEVSITRRMYRSGDSEYYINNTQCRLRDIRELIMDTGIGVDGYSLIGQGKISEIISGKPESRREIFEEAAGIVKYRSKKAETERKLANTNHNLERVNDIISELEGRIEPLRIESEKAVKYQELSGRFKENEINVTLKNIENTENKATELIVDLAASDKAIAEKENKRQIYERDLGIKKQRLEEIDKEDLAERDGIMQFNLELNELHNKVKLDKEKINSLASSVKLYGEEIQMLSEKLRREENNRAELDKRMATLSEKSSKVEADLKEITEQLAEAESEFAQKSDRFNEERDMIYDLTLQSSTKGAEISSLQQMGVSLRQRFQALHDLPATEEESAAKDALEKGLEQKELLIKEKMEADNKSQKFRQLLDELSAQEESLASKLEKSKISLSEEQTRKNMLQQLEDSYEGYNYAVRFIMKESGIGGIFGTAGELIRVPRGYETAIETALGARMQNIVCKDEICAEKAIKELKKRKIGRLTFLPVDSLRVQPEKSVSEIQGEEGYMGLASDCVDFDAKYRKAIAYLLGGIVIVKDLDNAVRISKKAPGFRYVTLEGEFINPAGAITGGTHKNSGAGIFDRKNRLSECDSRIAELTAEVKNSEFELKKASDGRNDAEKNLVAADADARKVEIDILNLENQLNGYRISMAKHEENMDRHRREVDRVQFEINENENAVVAVIKEKADIDAEIEKLKIGAEALLSESENSRQIITDLQIKQTAVRIDSSKLSSEILNVKGLIDLVVGRIAEIKNDVESKSAAEMSAISQQKSLKENIKEIQEDIVEKEKIQEKQTEKLAKLRDEKNLVSSEINKLSVSKDEIDKELFAEKTLRHELSVKLENINSKIESWKNRLWDEFETSYIQAIEFKKIDFNINEGLRESKKLRDEIRKLGDVNISAIAEYESVAERYKFLTEQRLDLTESITSLKQIISDTDAKIKISFKNSFDAISMNFEKIFTELFGGGKAELRVDSEKDLLEADIDIIVQPPGKKLQNMNLLSGGEKTMTAIALMFAVLKTRPTPFCILDEVEAALDEANIERFAEYLVKFENIQFVLVTHQKRTMEYANVLYGVTMPEKGISKVLSLKLAEAEQLEGLS